MRGRGRPRIMRFCKKSGESEAFPSCISHDFGETPDEQSMTSRINLSGHVSRTDRARYNEAQGIEILRGNSRDAHAETADHRPGSPARDGAAQPVEPAHARLRPGARVGVPHVPRRRHQLHHVERRAAARRGLLGIDARAVRDPVRKRDLPPALHGAHRPSRVPLPRPGPHHRRHAGPRLRHPAERTGAGAAARSARYRPAPDRGSSTWGTASCTAMSIPAARRSKRRSPS